jgi:hypothetical protein
MTLAPKSGPIIVTLSPITGPIMMTPNQKSGPIIMTLLRQKWGNKMTRDIEQAMESSPVPEYLEAQL